jgi:hypothetical protein
MRKILLLLLMIFLASCGRGTTDYAETDYTPVFAGTAEIVEATEIPQEVPVPDSAPEPYFPENAAPWQLAYAELLRGYAETDYDIRFFLHDFTKSGIPEMVVFGHLLSPGYGYFEAVYSFAFGEVTLLENDVDIPLWSFLPPVRRVQLHSAPNNTPGLVGSWAWAHCTRIPGGFCRHYNRIVVVGNKLTVDLRGTECKDQNEILMLPDGASDDEIMAHTYYFVGDEPVSREHFEQIFQWDGEISSLIHDYRLTEENIREVLTEWQPEEVIFRTTQRVHADMPEFTFYRIVGDRLSGESDYEFAGIERYATIIIKDENGNLIQEIDGIIQGGHHRQNFAIHEDTFGIRFADFNFDGYLDMWVYHAINPGTAGGSWAYYWLWNPETAQFEENAQLNSIHDTSHLSVNEETQQIQNLMRFRNGHWFTTYFEYENGEFVAAESVEEQFFHKDFVPSYLQTTHTNLRTGEVTIETDPPNHQPHEVRHTLRMQNHPDPDWDAVLKKWRLPADSEYRAGGYEYEIAVHIYGGHAPIIVDRLKIDGTENPLRFIDMNGDGYADMVLRRTPGVYDIWLWDPEEESVWRQFRNPLRHHGHLSAQTLPSIYTAEQIQSALHRQFSIIGWCENTQVISAQRIAHSTGYLWHEPAGEYFDMRDTALYRVTLRSPESLEEYLRVAERFANANLSNPFIRDGDYTIYIGYYYFSDENGTPVQAFIIC